MTFSKVKVIINPASGKNEPILNRVSTATAKTKPSHRPPVIFTYIHTRFIS